MVNWPRSMESGRNLAEARVERSDTECDRDTAVVTCLAEPRVYSHCGLRVRSAVELPWRRANSAGPVDVEIRVSAVTPVTHGPDAPVAVSFDRASFRLSVSGVGRYQVQDGSRITVDPVEGSKDEDIQLYLCGSVFGALWHQRGVLALHASAVLVDGGCLLFAGRSGAGKSTIAAAFERAGYSLVSDDVSVIDQDGSLIGVWPAHPRLKLAPDSLRAIGETPVALPPAGGTRGKLHLAVRRRTGERPVPVRRFYLLERGNGHPGVEPLSGLDAIDAVAGHTYCYELVEPLGYREAWLRRVVDVARRVSVCRLVRPWNLDRLEEGVHMIRMASATSRKEAT